MFDITPTHYQTNSKANTMKYTKLAVLCLLIGSFLSFKPATTNSFHFNKYGKMAHQSIQPNHFNQSLLETMVADGINQIRSQYGMMPLSQDKVLRKAAKEQNNYVKRLGKLTHQQTSAYKRSFSDRIDYYGGNQFSKSAENLQYKGFVVRTYVNNNQETKRILYPTYAQAAEELVQAWLQSNGHRDNILSERYQYVGTAVSFDAQYRGFYATQVYGGLRGCF